MANKIWEYRVIDVAHGTAINEYQLTELGNEGFELRFIIEPVGTYHSHQYIFIREKPEGSF